MTKRGKPYKATLQSGGEDAVKRGLVAIRNVYRTSGVPTPEQEAIIAKCESIADGTYKGDPFAVYRNAGYLGVEVDSEEKHKDGKWYPFQTDDDAMTNMQKGAL